MNGTAQLRYAGILQNLKGFDDWLRRLAVPVRQADRAHHAIRVLEEAERAFQSGTNHAGMSKSDYLFGLTAALELHDVYLTAIKKEPDCFSFADSPDTNSPTHFQLPSLN